MKPIPLTADRFDCCVDCFQFWLFRLLLHCLFKLGLFGFVVRRDEGQIGDWLYRIFTGYNNTLCFKRDFTLHHFQQPPLTMAKSTTAKQQKKKTNQANVPNPQRQRKKASAAARTALLTHDTKEKRSKMQLQLHLRRTERAIANLRQRLEHWDHVEEAEKKRKIEEEESQPKKKRPKWNSPETWKLKGAARPAWMVYDFDTRYVDPHLELHKKAKEKNERLMNLLVTPSFDLTTVEEGREFLSLLMQYGHLSLEARKRKVAQDTFLECLRLDKGQATTAADALMTIYLEDGNHAAAFDLGCTRPDDPSVCVRYSTVLAAFHLERNESCELMERAIRSNVFCAHYLTNIDVFASAIDCIDELEDPQTDLEEALDYCSQNVDRWRGKPSATLRSCMLEMKDVPEWKGALKPQQKDDADVPDMFLRMFETAMEMANQEDGPKSV